LILAKIRWSATNSDIGVRSKYRYSGPKSYFWTLREFLMGAEDGEAHERPLHKVVLGKSFYIGAYTVTQREWRAVMGTEPWAGRDLVERGDRFPAVCVNWEDAKAFLAKLNAADSNNYYRLPTEEEWEFVARAGTTSRFSFGDDETALNAYGWYKKNAYDGRTPSSAGRYEAAEPLGSLRYAR
jgi:formylglycine-generating enzyme required for sulfatase activity